MCYQQHYDITNQYIHSQVLGKCQTSSLNFKSDGLFIVKNLIFNSFGDLTPNRKKNLFLNIVCTDRKCGYVWFFYYTLKTVDQISNLMRFVVSEIKCPTNLVLTFVSIFIYLGSIFEKSNLQPQSCLDGRQLK